MPRQDLRGRTRGHGLTLHVQTNGIKWWYQRLQISGKAINIGLGGYPLVTLPEARHAALQNAKNAQEGRDPRPSKRDVPTVADTLATVIERDAQTWR